MSAGPDPADWPVDRLDRLTREVHDAGARHRDRLGPLPPGPAFGAVVELRTALLGGGVPTAAAEAIYRYRPEVRTIWETATEWVVLDDARIVATDASLALLTRLLAVHDEVTTALWGDPAPLASLSMQVVAGAAEAGPAFAAWRAAGVAAAHTDAGRLFLALTALRYLRADVHAAAWTAAGHDAASVQELDAASPAREAIERDTDRRHAAALAGVDAAVRSEFVAGVRRL